MSRNVVAALLYAGAAAGCTSLGTGFERNVATTPPRYAENRVFFLPTATETVALTPAYAPLTKDEEAKAIRHGEPLTIVVNGVALPKDARDVGKTRDIAVLLDIGAKSDSGDTSMVVWYQRGVRPDQLLNFSNLLVYYEPFWDSRVAPQFRLRMVDVATERNQATRELLSVVERTTSSLAAFLPDLATSQGVRVAARAATLVLANRQNEVLLDYTVQFYSQQHVAASGGAGLGQLRRGAFVAVGRPDQCGTQLCGRDFWRTSLKYDPQTGQILGNKGADVAAPFMFVSVVTAESVVPKIVLERSASLFALLQASGQGGPIEQIASQAEDLQGSVQAYVKNEKLKRYRSMADLEDVVAEALNDKLSSEDAAYLRRTLSELSGAYFSSPDQIKQWWEGMQAKQCKLSAAQFRMECPSGNQ
jgi:hypothetical protein